MSSQELIEIYSIFFAIFFLPFIITAIIFYFAEKLK